MAAQAKKVVKRRRELKKIDKGQVHIKSSFNNTVRESPLRLLLSKLASRRRERLWNTVFVRSKYSLRGRDRAENRLSARSAYAV